MNDMIIPPLISADDNDGRAGAGGEVPSSTCAAGREAAGVEGIIINPIALVGPAPSSRRRKGEAKKYAPYNPADFDIGEVATRLLGPADASGRWRCPYHNDHNPSLSVDRASGYFRCWSGRCGKTGSSIDLVMHRHGYGPADFARAKDKLRAMGIGPAVGVAPKGVGASGSNSTSGQAGSSAKRGRWPKSLTPGKAVEVARGSIKLLRGDWPHSARVRDYCRQRGLNDQTIKRTGLGFFWAINRPDWWPLRTLHGLTIPWIDGGRLQRLEMRRLDVYLFGAPDEKEPPCRYFEVYRGAPVVYPRLEAIAAREPVAVVEGALDTLLLGQEVASLMNVVTFGSAVADPAPEAIDALRMASVVYLATDADASGEKAAGRLAERLNNTIRIRPPRKDWTRAHQDGIDLRAWWMDVLNNGPRSEPEPVAAPTVPMVSTVADVESRCLNYEDVDWRAPLLANPY